MTDFVIGAGARLSSKLHGLALLPLVLIIAGKGDKDTSLGDFVPSPSFNWLKAFAPKFQELGSAITGGILVAALVMMIAAGTCRYISRCTSPSAAGV